jgi:hypothetical protein
MNPGARKKLLKHLNLKDGKDFWITRITDIESRVGDVATFHAVYFEVFDLIVVYSTDNGYKDATMIELAFRKLSYNREQVLEWFSRYELRHYDVVESGDNHVPKLADGTFLNDNEVLVVSYRRWLGAETLTLDSYLSTGDYYVPKSRPPKFSLTSEDVHQIMGELGVDVLKVGESV